MEELVLQEPELVGRDEELSKLKKSLDNAIEGNGSTIFIAGEAGIGKTRLVTELKKEAGARGVNLVQGWCLAESLEPMMPIKIALRQAKLSHLISGDPPPLVLSAYLMNDAGMLISKAERLKSDIDSDIFAGMLQAVGNFIQDSLSSTMDHGEEVGLNSLGYGDYNILIQSAGNISLAIVVKGANNEFLIDDMKSTLKTIGNQFDDWAGDMASAKSIQPKISWFVDSGKYNGKFLVDDPKIKQENLFDNILLGLQRASEDAPIILFLDDLQWSDLTSLNLIHFLSRNTQENRILILGTYRPEDIAEGLDGTIHPLETTMQGMNREALFEKVELKRLDADSTVKVIESALEKTDFDKKFYDKLFKETDGSPLFILEVVNLLARDGTIKLDENGIWQFIENLDGLEIPAKIYDVVKRRLNRLSKEQKEILECASIIGEEWASEIVGVVTGHNRFQLLKNLSKIEKNHQLIHFVQDVYQFDHGKIREVLYNGIGEELRREYHRIVGDSMLEIYDENPTEIINELAYHYYEAGDKKAEKYLTMAGDQARDKYANMEAAQFYQKALEFMVVDDNPEILEKLGDTQILTGDFEDAIQNFTKAINAYSDKKMKARGMRKLADVFERQGEYENALELVENAKEIIMYENSLEHGRMCAVEGRVHWRKGDYPAAMPLFDFALGIFKTFEGAENDYGDTLRFVGNIYLGKGEFDEAQSYYEKSLFVMEEINNPYGIQVALGNIGIVYYSRGEMNKAMGYFERSMEIMETLGEKQGIARMLNTMGLTYLNQGKLDKALEYNNKSLRMQEIVGDKEAISRTLSTISIIYRYKGELATALDYANKGLELRKKLENKDGVSKSLSGIADTYLSKGEPLKALECAERSLRICEEIGGKRLMTYIYCTMAEAKLELGDVELSLEYAKKALAIAEEIGAKLEGSMSLKIIGMINRKLGLWQESLDNFNESLKISQELGDKKENAITHYEFALMWKAQGEPDKAKEHLEKALTEFENMGMKLWEKRAGKELKNL